MADAGVEAGRRPRYGLEDEALVGDDDARSLVVVQLLALKGTVDEFCLYWLAPRFVTATALRKTMTSHVTWLEII